MPKTRLFIVTPLLFAFGLGLTACGTQTATESKPAAVSRSQQAQQPVATPTPYPSYRTDELNTNDDYIEVGDETYHLYTMPATDKHALNEYTDLFGAKEGQDSGFYESEYIQLEDPEGKVLYSNKLDFYQFWYAYGKITGWTEAQGAADDIKFPSERALLKRIQDSIVPEATAKIPVLKEAHKVWDGTGDLNLPPTPSKSPEQEIKDTLNAHIYKRVTDMEVAITLNKGVDKLAGKHEYANGDVVVLKILENNRFTITGTTKDGKYTMMYDSDTGEIKDVKADVPKPKPTQSKPAQSGDSQQVKNEVQGHVNSTVTNVQVAITEGMDLKDLVGVQKYSDGSKTVVSGKDVFSLRVVGTSADGKYQYIYDGSTGEFTSK